MSFFDWFGFAADILGVGGVIVSVVTWLAVRRQSALLKELRRDYEAEQSNLIEWFEIFRDAVINRRTLNAGTLSQLREKTYDLRGIYKNIFPRDQAEQIESLFVMLDLPAVEIKREELCVKLDYIIAILKRRRG
ncbi:MAG: hypothetical protein LBK41_04935 [Clostridiales bacterium]|nr:hypothetical protein [Clostridiales bacterium]